MDDLVNALTDFKIWAAVFITYFVQYFVNNIPIKFKWFVRGLKVRSLRNVKKLRRNQDAVTYQSIKANAYFLFFVGSCAFFFVLVFIGPLSVLLAYPKWVFFVALSPVLVVEMVWLHHDNFAKELISRRSRLYVTKKSVAFAK